MKEGKCPLCGSTHFYVKDPDDEYETYEFECKAGEICFEEDVAAEQAPEVEEDTETYCTTCSWHDRFGKL